MDRRELDLKDLDAVLAEVDRLHKGGYRKSGQWKLAQICRHCAAPMAECIDGFQFKPPLLLRLLVPILGMKKSFFGTRRIKVGIRAPSYQIPPEGLDEAEEIQTLRQAVERLKQHKGPHHRHPIFGELTPEQWHEFFTIHTMHHLMFLHPQNSGGAG